MDFPRLMLEYRIYHFVFSSRVDQSGRCALWLFHTFWNIRLFMIYSHMHVTSLSGFFVGSIAQYHHIARFCLLIFLNQLLVLFSHTFASILVEFNTWNCKCVNNFFKFHFPAYRFKIGDTKIEYVNSSSCSETIWLFNSLTLSPSVSVYCIFIELIFHLATGGCQVN